jgi:hypothetical protein
MVKLTVLCCESHVIIKALRPINKPEPSREVEVEKRT